GSLACTHLIPWIGLALACRIAPRAWRERQIYTKHPIWRRWRERWHRSMLTAKPRERVGNDNPITWLGARDSFRNYAVWLIPLVGLFVWCTFAVLKNRPTKVTGMLFCVAALHVAIRLWIAMDASHTFSTSRRNGTLESLLGTPLSPREIGEGMVSALRKRFLWPGMTLGMLAMAAGV